MHSSRAWILGTVGTLSFFSACAGIASHESAVDATAVSDSASVEPQTDLPVKQRQYFRSVGVSDCNENGIPDEMDIRLGYADDLNGNYRIDNCEVGYRGLSASWGWWRAADIPDSVYFSVRHTGLSEITIRYTVPPSDRPVWVKLEVFDQAGSEVLRLTDELIENGVYVKKWDRRANGEPLAAGTYDFRLSVGSIRSERQMAWQN